MFKDMYSKYISAPQLIRVSTFLFADQILEILTNAATGLSATFLLFLKHQIEC